MARKQRKPVEKFSIEKNADGSTTKRNGVYARTVAEKWAETIDTAEAARRYAEQDAARCGNALDAARAFLRQLLADHSVTIERSGLPRFEYGNSISCTPDPEDMNCPEFVRAAAESLCLLHGVSGDHAWRDAFNAGRLFEQAIVNRWVSGDAWRGKQAAKPNEKRRQILAERAEAEHEQWKLHAKKLIKKNGFPKRGSEWQYRNLYEAIQDKFGLADFRQVSNILSPWLKTLRV